VPTAGGQYRRVGRTLGNETLYSQLEQPRGLEVEWQSHAAHNATHRQTKLHRATQHRATKSHTTANAAPHKDQEARGQFAVFPLLPSFPKAAVNAVRLLCPSGLHPGEHSPRVASPLYAPGLDCCMQSPMLSASCIPFLLRALLCTSPGSTNTPSPPPLVFPGIAPPLVFPGSARTNS